MNNDITNASDLSVDESGIEAFLRKNEQMGTEGLDYQISVGVYNSFTERC